MINRIANDIRDGFIALLIIFLILMVATAVLAVIVLIYHIPWVGLSIVAMLSVLWLLGKTANHVFR